jgi:hypothetical protein
MAACCAQTRPTAPPDLDKFTSDQLRSCFQNSSICGTDDVYAISDELVSRLPAFTTEQLLRCFADWEICGAIDSSATGSPIAEEIARRGDPHPLLATYRTEQNRNVRAGLVEIANHFHTPEISEFMEQVLAEHKVDSDVLFLAADYLADQCNPLGLRWLSSRKGRDLACIQFAGTVKVFGKCHYRPAIPYLVTYSLKDACLNIVDDAGESLEALYPDHPAKFDSPEAEQKYYCTRARKEGYRVSCSAK